ncbi:MAG: hypothetical protein KAI64_02365 [Thermoplasmata archaeon]|nr:hypothetical protein [Thermoplasmata archaeon]
MSRSIETLHVATEGLVSRQSITIATRGWVVPIFLPPPPPIDITLPISPFFLEAEYDWHLFLEAEYDPDP